MNKVVIMGAGEEAKKLIPQLESEFEIIGFADNSIKKQHTVFEGYYVYSLDEVKQFTDVRIIISSIKYGAEIYKQLLSVGYREHDIIVDYITRKRNVYIRDLLQMQKNEYREFNRVDIIVKLLAIQDYLRGDESGVELYKRMQKKRLGLSNEMVEGTWQEFRKLIDDVEENGYDDNSCIVCDSRMHVLDGAHRIAICLYFDIPMIPVKTVPQELISNYDISWFWENSYTAEEIMRINNEYEKFNDNAVLGIIWANAFHKADEICDLLQSLVEINEIRNIEFDSFDNYKCWVRSIYQVDDIEAWKIEKKLEHMEGLSNYRVRVLRLKLKDECYRLKAVSGLPISEKVESLKRIVRGRYKNEIENYYHDIIFHVSDNYYQTEVLNAIIDIDRNVSAFFKSIESCKYVLSKLDVPYMPKDFPNSIPVHKDADILCIESDCENVSREALAFANKHFSQPGIRIKMITESGGTRVRIEYMDFLLYQFDISYIVDGLDKQFVSDAVSMRQRFGDIYICDFEHEVEIRKNELRKNPHKEHHKLFLQSHNCQ